MKYLKPECSPNEDSWHILTPHERETRDALWKQQCDLYNKEFNRIKTHFSKKIVLLYETGSLHDSLLQSFTVLRGKKRDTFDIEAVFYHEYRKKTVTIIYRDVKHFTSSLDFDHYVSFGDYVYGEFLYDKGWYFHNFIIIFDSEINIVCKKIVVK